MFNRRFFFFATSLFYLYIGLFLTHIFDLPEIFKSLFSLPSFILIPLLIGISFIESIKILKKNILLDLHGASYFALCLLCGLGLLSFLSVLLQLLHLEFLIQNFGYFVLVLSSLFFIVFSYFGKANQLSSELSLLLKRWWKQLFFLCTIAFGLLIYKLTIIPVPFTPWSSWANPIAQIQAVMRFIDQGFFDVTQRWMEIVFSSISCKIFNITCPEFFIYFATLIVTFILAVGTFALAKIFVNKTWVAVICGVFSMFLNSPIGYHEVVTYHFKSNTLLISLMPWIILLAITFFNKIQVQKFKNVIMLMVPSALFFVGLIIIRSSITYNFLFETGFSYEMQFTLFRPLLTILIPSLFFCIALLFKTKPVLTISGVLMFLNAVLYTTNESDFIIYFVAFELFILLYYFLRRTPIYSKLSLKIIAVVFSIIIFLIWINVISLPDLHLSSLLGFEQPIVDNSFDYKKVVLSNGNGLMTLYLLGIGISFLIFSRSKRDSLLLGILIILFGIFFFPEYWSIRMVGMTTPFIALALSKVFESIFRFSYSLPWKKKKIKLTSTFVVVLIVLIVLIPGLLSPIYTKLTSSPPSRLTSYEYEAAVWLRENTRETEIIISDYWTMLLLNPLSNKIWFTDRQFEAKYIDVEYKELLNELKINVFQASNSEDAYCSLLNLTLPIRENIDWTEKYYMNTKDIKQEAVVFLIVLSSRTVEWLKTSDLDVNTPQYLPIDSLYFVPFNDTQKFRELFSIPQQIYIFKVVM